MSMTRITNRILPFSPASSVVKLTTSIG